MTPGSNRVNSRKAMESRSHRSIVTSLGTSWEHQMVAKTEAIRC